MLNWVVGESELLERVRHLLRAGAQGPLVVVALVPSDPAHDETFAGAEQQFEEELPVVVALASDSASSRTPASPSIPRPVPQRSSTARLVIGSVDLEKLVTYQQRLRVLCPR